MYGKLIQMSGGKCYTLTAHHEAAMHVDEEGVTITYSTGNKLFIPRQMIEEAINLLMKKGVLTVEDVHEGITNRNGARTDRLMGILRKLPGVTHDKRPRVLYYSKQPDTT